MSLEIRQYWADSALPLTQASDRLYRGRPRLGLVIGTYAAVPYVHLQLEARRRLYPHVPVLVHDDDSPRSQELRKLCRDYGCGFECNSERLPHHLGDLSAFLGGLWWARETGVELLLKLSRRWIFLVDWTESLVELALESQNATFSNYTSSYAFGFRTECIGMAVRLWATPQFFRDAIERINQGEHVFVENYIHQYAIAFNELNSTQSRTWNTANPQPDERRGYAPWSLMGTDRIDPNPSGAYLWHDSHPPKAYAAQARKWGLTYEESDFADPNQGGGLGPANR